MTTPLPGVPWTGGATDDLTQATIDRHNSGTDSGTSGGVTITNLKAERESDTPSELSGGPVTIILPDYPVDQGFATYDADTGHWTILEAGLYELYLEVDLPDDSTSKIRYVVGPEEYLLRGPGATSFRIVLALAVDDDLAPQVHVAGDAFTPTFMYGALKQLLKF